MGTAIIVDDEPITRLDLSQMLEELGFHVLGAVMDGFEAVELCRQTKPDLVLMDVNMPVFDGLSATEQIIGNDLAGCVIIITGYGDGDTVARAVQAGVAGYLIKPVEKRQLMPAVALALESRRRAAGLVERAQQAERKLAANKIVERAKAHLARAEGIPEQEAYRRLQKLAMDKRCSLEAVARGVLDSLCEREVVNRAKRLLMEAQGLSEEEAYRRIAAAAKKRGLPLADMARGVIAGGSL